MEVLQTIAPADLCVGFLTIVQEAQGYMGGYLVTNSWGRPLEFRLTTAVQPNRIQQLLYGSTLQTYVCAELIGKTLVEKTSSAARIILTDQEPILELRRSVSTPMAWITESALEDGEHFRCNAEHPEDYGRIRNALATMNVVMDIAEPFTRIREAITEARKMGATARG